MAKTKCNANEVLMDMKSCIKKIHLPVKKELEEDDHVTVYSENSIGILTMYIQATFFKKQNFLGTCIRFSHGVPEERVPRLYGAVNQLNSMLMDIGSFCINPATGELFIRTSFPVPGGRIDKNQLMRTLIRLMCQGCRGFEPIARAVVENIPFGDIMQELLAGMPGKDTGTACSVKQDNLN